MRLTYKDILIEVTQVDNKWCALINEEESASPSNCSSEEEALGHAIKYIDKDTKILKKQ